MELLAGQEMASSNAGSSGSVWGITSDEMRASVTRFFLPTKDVNLVRKPRTREMEADAYLALVVLCIFIGILWFMVVKPFLAHRRRGIEIDDGEGGAHGEKAHRE